jgi:hypothetical protein
MAENRCIAAREDGSRLPSEGRLHRVSEQVDASMHSMQATVGDAVLDRSMAQPGQKQLGTGDDSVLRGRDTGDRSVPGGGRGNNCSDGLSQAEVTIVTHARRGKK